MDLNRPKLKQLAISKIPIFKSIAPLGQEQLAALLVLCEFKKDQPIIVSNQPGREIMFVADGAVDVKRSNLDGREVIVSRLGQGDFFGEISILTESNRTADVSAAEDSMLLILQAHDFETLLSAHREFARAFLVHLAARVAAASTRIADLALLDVYCRVYKVLQSLATLNPAGELHVAERPTHRDLAAMVGTSREMVTRALTRLSEDKIIQSDGPALKIVGRLAVY